MLTVAIIGALAGPAAALEYLGHTGFARAQAPAELWEAIASLTQRGLLDGHRPTPRVLWGAMDARERRAC